MAKPGDRVIVEGTKVGGARREGTLVEVVGRLIKVRWDGGPETLLTPAPGAVRFLPGSSKRARTDGGRAKSKASARPAGKKPAGTKKAAKTRGKAKR